MRCYENGTMLPIYTIALADVPSPDNLKPEVGNVYSVGMDSGNCRLISPVNGGLRDMCSPERSRVRTSILPNELTSMIESQRGFTANSKGPSRPARTCWTLSST